MQVAIAGGHGKIALKLARPLADRGERVRRTIGRTFGLVAGEVPVDEAVRSL